MIRQLRKVFFTVPIEIFNSQSKYKMLSLGLLQKRDEIINGKLTKAAPTGIIDVENTTNRF